MAVLQQLLSWLILPMLDLHTRLQNLHVRHAVVEAGFEVGTTLSFLLRRFSFALFVSCSSRCSTPALTVVFHDDLFPASWFHVLWLMLHLFRSRLQVSLYLCFGVLDSCFQMLAHHTVFALVGVGHPCDVDVPAIVVFACTE